MKLRVLLIGDTTRREFQEACTALDEVADVTRVAGIEAAIAARSVDQVSPHAIVLAQSYPGQFPAGEIERLRASAPLARLIALLGSWCEGEPRSGRPLPGIVRVYWYEAASRFRREFPSWFNRCSAWSLPITTTDEERMLASSVEPLPHGEGLVATWTRRPEMAELLADAFRSAGYATVWLHPRRPCKVQGAAAAIFDGDALDAATSDELKWFAGHVARLPLLVLLGAPRIQDVRAVKSLGGNVLAKPFRVAELLWALRSILQYAAQPSEGIIANTLHSGGHPCFRTASTSP
jgi:hypothetical protein